MTLFQKSLIIPTLTITMLGMLVLGWVMGGDKWEENVGSTEGRFTTQQATFSMSWDLWLWPLNCSSIDLKTCTNKSAPDCVTVTVVNQYRTENEIREKCKTFTIPWSTWNKTKDWSPERDRILEAKWYKPSYWWIVDYWLSCNEHLIESVEITASKCTVWKTRTVTIWNGVNDVKDFDFKLYLKSIGHKLSANPAILSSCDHKFRQICTDTGKKDSSWEKLGRRIRDHGHNWGVDLYEYFKDPNGNGCYPEDLNNTVVECIPKKIPGYSQRTKDTKMDCDEGVKGPASNNCGYKFMYPDRDGDGYGDKNHEWILSCPKRTKDGHGNRIHWYPLVDNKKDVCDSIPQITTTPKWSSTKFYADQDGDKYPFLWGTYEASCPPRDPNTNWMLPRSDNTRDCNDNDKSIVLGCKTCDPKDPSCPVMCTPCEEKTIRVNVGGWGVWTVQTPQYQNITKYVIDTPRCDKWKVDNIYETRNKYLWSCIDNGSTFKVDCTCEKKDRTLTQTCIDWRNENPNGSWWFYDYDCDGVMHGEDCNDCDPTNKDVTECKQYQDAYPWLNIEITNKFINFFIDLNKYFMVFGLQWSDDERFTHYRETFTLWPLGTVVDIWANRIREDVWLKKDTLLKILATWFKDFTELELKALKNTIKSMKADDIRWLELNTRDFINGVQDTDLKNILFENAEVLKKIINMETELKNWFQYGSAFNDIMVLINLKNPNWRVSWFAEVEKIFNGFVGNLLRDLHEIVNPKDLIFQSLTNLLNISPQAWSVAIVAIEHFAHLNYNMDLVNDFKEKYTEFYLYASNQRVCPYAPLPGVVDPNNCTRDYDKISNDPTYIQLKKSLEDTMQQISNRYSEYHKLCIYDERAQKNPWVKK